MSIIYGHIRQTHLGLGTHLECWAWKPSNRSTTAVATLSGSSTNNSLIDFNRVSTLDNPGKHICESATHSTSHLVLDLRWMVTIHLHHLHHLHHLSYTRIDASLLLSFWTKLSRVYWPLLLLRFLDWRASCDSLLEHILFHSMQAPL